VQLTPEGRRQFRAMARAHEAWVMELFAGLSASQQRQLFELLGQLKQTLPPR
jgi:DNA-binding MarR family transcriptional regulator